MNDFVDNEHSATRVWRNERGVTTVEWVGLAMAVALLLFAVTFVLQARGNDIGNTLGNVIGCHIGSFGGGGNCGQGAAAGDGVVPTSGEGSSSEPSTGLFLTSLGLDFIPIVGEIKGLIEVVTGYDLVTGEDLGWWRFAGLAGIIGLNEIRHLRHGDEVVGVLRHGDEAAALARQGDELERIRGLVRYREVCSFSPETPVQTAQGLRPIASLVIGDQVHAFHEQNGQTGLFTVTAVLSHVDPAVLWLTIDGETLATTPEHSFYRHASGWVPAANLEAGDLVRRIDGGYGVVEAHYLESEPQVMYNLTVIDAHTYFVGEQGWLVHNTCAWINFNDLPLNERNAIQETLDQIQGRLPPPAAGSPKFRRWGSEFRNFNNDLPTRGPGYYQEYRVVPQGQNNAGTLRIVTGRNGEMYYTWTHYGDQGAPAFVRIQ